MQCAQYPFISPSTTSCPPASPSSSPSPPTSHPTPCLPPPSWGREVFFWFFSQVARRNLPGIRCSRMLPIPPQVDSQSAHNQLTKTRICDVVHLKKKLEWVPWWILRFIVPQWSVQCCYTSCTACPETCTCHEYDPVLCTWGKGTLLGLGSSGVTALARQLVPWLEPLHWLELILLLLLGPSCPSLPPGNWWLHGTWSSLLFRPLVYALETRVTSLFILSLLSEIALCLVICLLFERMYIWSWGSSLSEHSEHQSRNTTS